MTSRPRVYTRIRPLNETELRQDSEMIYGVERGHRDTLVYKKDSETMNTRFDHVFDHSATQVDVFNQVGVEVLDTLFHGYNASVFAYGQTGSGKTYTMEGMNNETHHGLIPRLIKAVFDKYSSNPDITDASVQASFVQIYQEKVQDLFNGRKLLEIHMDRTGQYIAQNAVWREVKNPDDALTMYHEAVKQRAVSSTEMNLVSSRSHTILMLKLQWDEPTLPGSHAQLNLVDLAGSEKLYQSGAVGETMKEAISINKSLSALGNVVSKLVDQAKHKGKRIHIPYKDSKLTYLLQSSLGGTNLVHFMLALSASSLWRAESAATVEFGKRALQLVLKPVRNPIDYKRLEEMEAMIEKMRNKIATLEDELKTNQNTDNTFLSIKHLQQEGETKRMKRRARAKSKANLKTKTELNRIVTNLPETLEDLTSHCVLFPNSKKDFREMEGLQKLVGYIARSPSTFYKAHAAHTVAHVLDDEGRETIGQCGGMEAISQLLLVKEERCKEAACVALEAAVRNCNANKDRVGQDVYEALAELIVGYANQQVQEAACTALASLVDSYAPGKKAATKLNVVEKLLKTIRDSPVEVVHVTKAATTCVGRLAHGDIQQQNEIAKLGGMDLIIDKVLFSPVGDRDHQVPILASYALVNLACSNSKNMDIVRQHPRYEEVRTRLMEGLARAFGNNTVREGFGRATAQETTSPFPYYGITVQDKWTPHTCGGRPIFSTFMENPQFYLYINQETKVSLMIQDILYEARMQQKQKNNTVYMGLAVFHGEADLCTNGLKQLDFHGKMAEIAKFTSNCENVLHCTLPKSDTPYIVVPFTSQRGRTTTFALSGFSDKPVDLTPVPETTGWMRRILEGSWNTLTGRGGDAFEWRNNPQVRLSVKENTRVVFILSYRSLDDQRSAKRVDEGGEEEKQNTRPRLHGRLFTNSFAPEKRYLKALVPLPQQSTFVASNSFSSNSYITTAASLAPGTDYVYVPFTEIPIEDTWRLCVYSDNDEIDVSPLNSKSAEWATHSVTGAWKSEPLKVNINAKGKLCVIASSKDTFLRLTLFGSQQQKLCGTDSYWNCEGNVEYENKTHTSLSIVVEGMVKNGTQQSVASTGACDIVIYCQDSASKCTPAFPQQAGSLELLTADTAAELIRYPEEVQDVADVGRAAADPAEEGEETDGEMSSGGEEDQSELIRQMSAQIEEEKSKNLQLMDQVRDNEGTIQLLRSDSMQMQARLQLQNSQNVNQNGASGTTASTPTRGRTPARGSPVTQHAPPPPARTNSSSGMGARRTSRTDLGSQQGNRAGYEAAKVSHDVAQKIGFISAADKPPSAAEWMRIKKELKDCQSRLMQVTGASNM